MTPSSILIVEDEAVVALDLKYELEELGYHVVGIADTAQQAIELARRHRPQLTLMDVMLKGEVDGIEAAQALRGDPGSAVMFLTSYSDSDTVQRAAQTAAYGYLTKPFQLKELRAGIEVALWKIRMEQQLRESDRWFALTLRCVQDGVVVVNVDGSVRSMNPAAEALLGTAAAVAAGRPVGEVVRFEAPGDDPPLPLAVELALRERRVIGVRPARRLAGTEAGAAPVLLDESAGPIDDEHGACLGAVMVLRDARERVQHEALLRASEDRFRNAFEYAPLGMALVSLDGRFLQVNEALCRLLGSDAAALVQRSQRSLTLPQDVAHEEARLAELQAEQLPEPAAQDGSATPRVVQFEKRYRCGGALVWVLVNASVLRSADAPVCFLYQVHDLTAQKAAAAQLAELAAARIDREAREHADRARGEFLSRVSHEMRTPLNAVLGFAQLLKLQQPGDPAPRTDYPEHIQAAGQHLLALVDDLLDIQSATGGSLHLQLERVALDQAVPAALALLGPLAAARSVRIEVSIAPGLHVKADETRLRQVLLNLGSNAIKYNRDGGTVRLTAGADAPSTVWLRIEDTGIGMSDEQLAHLFEPFNRLGREALRVPGVGLGLVISRKLVEHMGGVIAVRRRDGGEGTAVTVELPAAEEHEA